MKRITRRASTIQALVMLGFAFASPAAADPLGKRYAVELLGPNGDMIAAGTIEAVIDTYSVGKRIERIEGLHDFDRSEPGTPPFMRGGKVYGKIRGRRIQLSLAVPLLDRVAVDAWFLDAQRDRFIGEWRYATSAWFTSGVIRAYAFN
jgi:hypothetical protein